MTRSSFEKLRLWPYSAGPRLKFYNAFEELSHSLIGGFKARLKARIQAAAPSQMYLFLNAIYMFSKLTSSSTYGPMGV
jgi:hypothetical protein